MTTYEVDAHKELSLRFSPNEKVEVSFSGRMKVIVKRPNSDPKEEPLAVAFLNCSTYMVQGLKEQYEHLGSLELILENFEPTAADVYVRRLYE